MEAVHKTSARPWIDRTKINVRNFVQDWTKVEAIKPLTSLGTSRTARKKKQAPTKADNAEQLICPKTLTCEGEDVFLGKDEWSKGKIPDNVELNTIKERSLFYDLVSKDKKYRRELFHSQRYMVQQSLSSKSKESKTTVSNTLNEAILTVEVYRPLHSMKKSTDTKNYTQIVPDQVYEVISSLPLSALRDQIRCVADNRHNREVSNDPDSVTHGLDAGHVYKSGYFYIDETFYNDLRFPECIDLSDVIINWTSQSERGIGPFKKSVITQTFADLTIQLGYPYLYVHQGNCEHMVVFSDLRLFKNSRDSTELSNYPKFIHSNRRPHINCIFCKVNVAKWYVKENVDMPEDPSFLCERCFRMFCYDSTGQKTCDFKAYPFLDKSVLV